jgi:MCP family monocarboxylic acid transporter-like MFS transporter 10
MEKREASSIGSSRKQDGSSAVPPDGGTRAWLVMIASFLCNGILFGVINTYSVIYVDLQKKLEEKGVAEASSKACKYKDKFVILVGYQDLKRLQQV